MEFGIINPMGEILLSGEKLGEKILILEIEAYLD